MKALYHLNVIFDVVADRDPFADASRDAIALVERGVVEGWAGAHSVTTLFYLVQRRRGARTAQRATGALLSLMRVAPVDEDRLTEALADGLPDFEDAVQAACARALGAHYIVTRDPKGFWKSTVPGTSPREFIAVVEATQGMDTVRTKPAPVFGDTTDLGVAPHAVGFEQVVAFRPQPGR